jgi:hypothetical protein
MHTAQADQNAKVLVMLLLLVLLLLADVAAPATTTCCYSSTNAVLCSTAKQLEVRIYILEDEASCSDPPNATHKNLAHCCQLPLLRLPLLSSALDHNKNLLAALVKAPRSF